MDLVVHVLALTTLMWQMIGTAATADEEKVEEKEDEEVVTTGQDPLGLKQAVFIATPIVMVTSIFNHEVEAIALLYLQKTTPILSWRLIFKNQTKNPTKLALQSENM